ncbi:MAG: hypothetical protein ACK456_07550 [Pseudanabaenaceae cyanobacterium]|jgi:hypothetical protein
MKFRRFMGYIWHINGFLILFVGLLAGGVLALSALQILRDVGQRRSVSDVANVSSQDSVIAKSEFGDFEVIPQTNVSRAPLYIRQEYDYRLSGKEASSVRNYVFFDGNKKVSYWLKPQNNGLIMSYVPVFSLPNHVNPSNGKEASVLESKPLLKPLSNIYVLIESDTNQDQRLNEADLKTIAVSTPVGTQFKPLVPGVTRFHGHAVSPEGKVTIFYYGGNKLKAMEYDPITQNVISEGEVADLSSKK